MEFRILGPLEVSDGGHLLPLSGAKQRALLAALLLRANEVVPSDRLIEEVWGEESPESGATALRVRLSQLRKALPENTIATRPPGYVIRVERDQLDLRRFERLVDEGRRSLETKDAATASAKLAEALALWRGPALADLAYEDFAQPAISRLEELRLAALELRIEADLALGRQVELVGELEALVAEHPLRERLRAQLMLALYRSGRQAEALEAYRAARRALAEELGIDPTPALKELERAILRQDPALDLRERAGSPPGEAASASPGRSILIVPWDEQQLETLIQLAEPLATRPAREIIFACLVADELDLAPTTVRLHERREALVVRGISARAAAFTSNSPAQDLVRLAVEQEVELALVDAPAELLEEGVPSPDLSALLAGAPCDVALLVGRDVEAEGAVLVPFGGVEHDWCAVELGAWIAGARGAPLKLLGAAGVDGAGKRDASRLLSYASLAVQRALGVASEPVLVSPGNEGILQAAEDAGFLVLGLSSRWHREGLGATRLALARNARPPTLLVRRGLRPGGLAPRASLTHFTWSLGPA
jgi:DNA-binding SARP family transcriptional activator